jgi:hypothetical protein
MLSLALNDSELPVQFSGLLSVDLLDTFRWCIQPIRAACAFRRPFVETFDLAAGTGLDGYFELLLRDVIWIDITSATRPACRRRAMRGVFIGVERVHIDNVLQVLETVDVQRCGICNSLDRK